LALWRGDEHHKLVTRFSVIRRVIKGKFFGFWTNSTKSLFLTLFHFNQMLLCFVCFLSGWTTIQRVDCLVLTREIVSFLRTQQGTTRLGDEL